jgi:hypothetical protein
VVEIIGISNYEISNRVLIRLLKVACLGEEKYQKYMQHFDKNIPQYFYLYPLMYSLK